MIRFGSYHGPDLRSDPYVAELQQALFEYLRRPLAQRQQRRAPIEESFFFSNTIQQAVAGRCYNKCFFCESRDGDESVDHFRPTRDARDVDGKVHADFYAWLAYETDNLILICPQCRANRGTSFPVIGSRAPYIATLPEIRRHERPLLVDAYHDFPDRHFDFLIDGSCVPLTGEGAHTSEIVGLNRDRLLHERRRSIDEMMATLRKSLFAAHGGTISELFDVRRPYAGARLNVLKRLLQGVPFRGKTVSGRPAQLAGRLIDALNDVNTIERERLDRRFDDLIAEDRDRIEQGPLRLRASHPLPVQDDTPPFWQETGGIAELDIANFKGIERLTLSVPQRLQSKSAPCLMLLGENAVGKSSILQAIALALLGGVEARKLKLEAIHYLRNEANERWDQLTTDNAVVSLQLRFNAPPANLVIDGARKRIMGDEKPQSLVLGYGPRRYFDPKKTQRPEGAYGRVQTLFKPTAAIPYPGTWLNGLDDGQFDQVAQVIRVVLSLADDDELVRDRDQRICVNIAGKLIPVDWLSDGYRSVFVMVADMLRELMPRYSILEDAEAVVLIDEIETHLHPRWKMRVMSSLRRALPRVQFIVTTHDPLCLRGMDDGEVAVLQRDANGQITRLQDLPSIKGMRADQLLTSDYFGLSSTIDPETERDMARYVARVDALPEGRGSEADELITHLTIGDDAPEQVMHEAMRRFIVEREKPTGELRPDIREETVQRVLAALKADIPKAGRDPS